METEKRLVTGILLLDKAIGLSSNAALQQVKRLFSASKAGHTGSLDPLASGMLPICFGEATKFSQFLLHANKTYRVIAKLGIKTTTSDAEGEVIQTRKVSPFNFFELNQILNAFRGTILQVPSMFSALKVNGQPLYKLARKGIEVKREPRQISIYSLKVLNFSQDRLELEVVCSSGTYIRNLVEDIGEALGCGAHVIALRRLQVGSYHANQMKNMEEIQQKLSEVEYEQLLLPIDSALVQHPKLIIDQKTCIDLFQGKKVPLLNPPETLGLVKLYSHQGPFIGIGELINGAQLISKRLINFSHSSDFK